MDKLSVTATQYTPEISMDPAGLISITGKSYPENTFDFYKPVIDWLDNYFMNGPPQKTTINMEIVYFNSSSSKLFFDFFDILDEHSNESEIEINWIFDNENENARESGEDFIEDFENLHINLVSRE